MTPIIRLEPADPVRHIDARVALTLNQALHRHLEPAAVLEVLWSQAGSLVQASGLSYRHGRRGLELAFGGGGHTATYTLSHDEGFLGELTLHFRRPAPEHALAAAEDLVALAVPALRNALAHHAAGRAAAGMEDADLAGPAGEDALVLVAIDDLDAFRARHGEVWTQMMVQTAQTQIREGLRRADSVFMIEEGLLAVLLPATSQAAALEVAAKIRVLVAGLHLRHRTVTSQLSACMGVTGAGPGQSPDDVLKRARQALARAREDGASSIRAS